MNASVRTALLAVLLAASAVAPAVAAEGPPQGVPAAGEAAAAPPAPDKSSGEPSKVYIAAGIGPGLNARFKVNGNTVSFSDQFQGTTDKSPLVAVNVASFGLALNSKTLVGIDLSAVAQLGTIAGNATHVQITNSFAALTYFPWETGLYLRGGVGISSLVTVSGSQSDRVNGIGALLGAGYALQVSGRHHLTLTYTQTWQSYSSSGSKPDSSQFGAVYLGYMYRS